jgi:2-keto-3-deoxy-L-rhamnonate aldolase RhmA
VLAAAQRHGKGPGLFTTDGGMAGERIRQGFRIIELLGDVAGMRAGCAANLAQVRTVADEITPSA